MAATGSDVDAFSVSGSGDLSLASHASLASGGAAAGIAFDPDGKLVAVSDAINSTVDLFSASGGNVSFLNSVSSGQAPAGVAFSPSGDLLAAANPNSSNVSLFTVGSTALVPVTGSPFTQPNDPGDDPVAVAFNRDGWLAIVNGDSYLTVHTIGADDELQEPGTTYGPIGNLPGSPVFSPSGQFLDILDSEYSEVYAFAALGPPAATIHTPASGGTYGVGQVVDTSFSCADSVGAPGIASCTDSNGATGGTGTLNTSTAGTHTYSVTAVSQDGLSSTAQITYTVSARAVGSAGPVTVSATTAKTTLSCIGSSTQTCSMAVSATVQETLSGSKVVAVQALATKTQPRRTVKTVVIGSVAITLRGGATKTVTLTLNSTGRALVALHHSLPARVQVTQGRRLVRSQRVTFTKPKRKAHLLRPHLL